MASGESNDQSCSECRLYFDRGRTWVGVVLWPVAAYSVPEAPLQAERVTCPTNHHALLRLETQITEAEGPLSWEGTFVGNANETVVLYWESFQQSPYERFELYDPQGIRVIGRYYPFDLEPRELEGQHRRFDLLQTGEYRLVFTVDPGPINSPDALPPVFLWPPEKLEYLLRVRVASYYERLMFHANQLTKDNRPEAALPIYALAIEQCPDRPQPYIGRLIAYGGIAHSTAHLEVQYLVTTDYIETLFQSLDARSQAVVLSDLRQLAQTDRDEADGESQVLEGPDYQLFNEVADFLETGIVSDRLLEAIEEF